MRRCLAFGILLGMSFLALPACGQREPVNHLEELSGPRIPNSTKKSQPGKTPASPAGRKGNLGAGR
jgi:hypothetical protein